MSSVKIKDTICAITTPIGIGAIAGIRISGKNTLHILKKIIRSKITEGRVIHSFLSDNKNIIDEVILFFRKAPNTYTGCDEAEIFSHGGLAIPEMIIEVLEKNGCRMANPGEFTQRAFLNGKLDLVQVESIMDIVNAKTKNAAVSAVSMLKGTFSKEISQLRNNLVSLSALIEANLDFPEEEDINFDKSATLAIIDRISDTIEKLISKDEDNLLLKRGLNIVITGKPNVGKSSLFNTMLSKEKAIVTNIPGTTRDVLEGLLNINGIPVLIKDTAGIRVTKDPIENIGIEKTKNEIKHAHIVIALFDVSRTFDNDDYLHLSYLKNAKNVFFILSKSDLKAVLDISELPEISGKINCRDESAELEINKLIYRFIKGNRFSLNLNDRITENLKKALIALKRARKIINHDEGLELASIETKEAVENLSAITGEITTEQTLNNIFSTFCIGK